MKALLAVLFLASPAMGLRLSSPPSGPGGISQSDADTRYLQEASDTADVGSLHTFNQIQVNGGILGSGVLQVQGASQFGVPATTITAAGLLQLVAGSTITTNNGTLSFSTAASAALTTQTPIFFTKDGRVGIGGNRFNVAPSGSPTAPDGNVLMMFGKGTDDGAMEAILFTGQGVGGPAGSGSFTTSEKIILYNTAGSKAAIFQPNDGAFGISGTGDANSFIGFYTANTSAAPPERMRIHSDGNVGISTNAPTSTLHVAGSAQFGSGPTASSVTVGGYFRMPSKTKAQISAITPGATGEILFCTDCAVPNICVSTGTAISAFVRSDLTGTGCGSDSP